MPVLAVRSLVTELRLGNRHVPVVDDVSFTLERSSTLAVVGESGCGKSMMALSLLRILPEPLARVASGSILLDGLDLAAASNEQMRAVRGKEVSIIFQDPMASLNPVETVGNQIVEVLREHEALSYREARRRAIDLLRLVRLADAEKRIDDYPHRLSGGMCQRVMIAMALACRPKVLIADEPTTALDVTVQAQILALLKRIQVETGTAIILITHNLALVAKAADRVLVMYAGKIVESGPVQDVLRHPRHPYTKGLLGAIPSASGAPDAVIGRLAEIPGSVPAPGRISKGCAFAARCAHAMARCRVERPDLAPVRDDHAAACFIAAAEAA